MATKIGINGFGRIGRLVFRDMWNRADEFEIVAINNPTGAEMAAYLLKYDSVHGTWQHDIKVDGDTLVIDGKSVHVFHTREASEVTWEDFGAQIVIESTGKLKSHDEAMQHVHGTVKKVIITAPGKDDDATLVVGVNHTNYDPEKDTIISNASCTTNCLAPVAKVIHEKFGIVRGLMTTIHSYTNDQAILEKAHKKDPRRGRAAAENMVPTSTGAAKAMGIVIPDLKGKLNGLAIRVPTPDVSLVDLSCELATNVTKEELNAALKDAAEGSLKGILAYTDEPLVSRDFVGTSVSSTVDGDLTMVIDGNLVKVIAWYDNEWGYSCRISDLTAYVASKGL